MVNSRFAFGHTAQQLASQLQSKLPKLASSALPMLLCESEHSELLALLSIGIGTYHSGMTEAALSLVKGQVDAGHVAFGV